MAYPSPRQLQLRRGNTATISTYTGPLGEIIINTDNWGLYIQDGVTAGGHLVSGGGANYSDSNVKSYLNSFDGNIIPSANVTYSLGDINHQWKSLYVSNNTIYINGVPLSIDAGGNLSINGNTVSTVNYVNTQVANIDLTGYATVANLNLKADLSYVNDINTSFTAGLDLKANVTALTAANVGMQGYVDRQISNLIGGAPGILDTLGEIAASINDEANVYASLVSSINSSNLALKGYVDQANTIQSQQLTQANIGIVGYVDQSNSIQSGQLTQANLGMKGYVDNAVSTIVIPVTYSNVNVKAYTETMGFKNYSNVNVAAYLSANPTTTSSLTNGSYSFTLQPQGHLTVPTSQYSTAQMFSNAGVDFLIGTLDSGNFWQFRPSGIFQFPDYTQQTTAFNDTSANIRVAAYLATNNYLTSTTANLSLYAWNSNVSSSYSNVQVATYLPTYSGNIQVGNVFATAAYRFGTGSAKITMVDSSVVLTPDTATNALAGVVIGGNGYLLSPNSARNAVLNYNAVNGQMGIYKLAVYGNQPDAITNAGTSNVGNIGGSTAWFGNAYINTVYAATFVGNGSQLTGLPASYSNVQVATYLSTASINTTGNITAAYLTGNISITGNVTGTSANVTLQAGAYTSVFDNLGNVTVPKLFTAGNIQTSGYLYGNGAFLTGVVTGSSYSNVQVASYLATGQITTSNIKLAPSGNIVFADGTTQITAAVNNNYSNVNVAAYTVGLTNYSNVNTAAYLATASITTTGNITAAYLSGNINLTGNIQGTSSNVQLVAGGYTTTFDNQGNVAFGNVLYPVQTSTTGTATIAGTVFSNGNTNATAFAVVGTGAVSNVALGYFPPAGVAAEMAIRDYSTANSTMYFDNTIGSGNVGGSFQFRSTSSFTQYAKIDRFGVTQPTRPAFRINGIGGLTQTTSNVNIKLPQITVAYNQGNYFNATTGQFVAPVAGIYQVGLVARVGLNNGLNTVAVLKNGLSTAGNVVCWWEADTNSGTATHFGVNGTVILAVGDYLSANILTGNITFDNNDNWSVTYLG